MNVSDALHGGPLPSNMHELLQKHMPFLYYVLEPREVADEMFQAGHFSIREHDFITESTKKLKRLQTLLCIVEKRNLYCPLLYALQSLSNGVNLDMLKNCSTLAVKLGKFYICF